MWLGALLMIVTGCALGVIGELGRRGSLPRNRGAGLRSAAAMTDDQTWREAHRVAGPWLLGAAAPAFACAALALAAGGAGWARSIILGLIGLMVAFVFLASRFGEQAAKKVLEARAGQPAASPKDRPTAAS